MVRLDMFWEQLGFFLLLLSLLFASLLAYFLFPFKTLSVKDSHGNG